MPPKAMPSQWTNLSFLILLALMTFPTNMPAHEAVTTMPTIPRSMK